MAVQVGQPAPDFALKGVVDGEFVDVKLSDYRGKWVVLFFYPLDFTFVCPTEIQGFAKHNEEFEKLGAQVLGASVDSEHSHKAWIERDFGSLPFPLLSDIRREATGRLRRPPARRHRAARHLHRRPRGHAQVRRGARQQHRPQHRRDAPRPPGAPDRRALPGGLAARPGDAELDVESRRRPRRREAAAPGARGAATPETAARRPSRTSITGKEETWRPSTTGSTSARSWSSCPSTSTSAAPRPSRPARCGSSSVTRPSC